jgi:hypothetical protein
MARADDTTTVVNAEVDRLLVCRCIRLVVGGIVISTAVGLLAIENESGELDIYGLPGFEKRTQLNFSSKISVVSFSEAGGRVFASCRTRERTCAPARGEATQAAAR